MIKASYVLVFLSVALMAVMIFQTVDRELKLHNIKAGMVMTSEEVKKKEEDIDQLKKKVVGLKDSLSIINGKVDELKMKQELTQKSTKEHETKLEACNKLKEETVRKRTEVESTSVKLHNDHEASKNRAQQEIQSLKQQILNRDKTICAFADMTKEQARKLCGVA